MTSGLRILVLDANYPHAENLCGDVFVHVRVGQYLALGHHVRVVAFFTDRPSYTFDGVNVDCAPDLAALNGLIDDFAPDVIAIHFFQGWMLRKVVKRVRTPIVVWVHGMEALGWYRRLFNFEFSREFFDYVKYSSIQMVRFRGLLRYAHRNPTRVSFVFVSNWMRRVAEIDTLTRAPQHEIIPNPIDTARFPYSTKNPSLRTHVLLIRSFDSRKYANDIAIDAIRRFSEFPEFREFQFSIHGRGRMFDKLTRPITHMENVTVREGFLTHVEIANLHNTHGVMLCPTRQDAQGVSMCEAMSSGLVPVSSRSTAIPEFVTDGKSGFLTDDSAEIVAALRRLYFDPQLFSSMSKEAASSIRMKSGVEQVINRELHVMQVAAGGAE